MAWMSNYIHVIPWDVIIHPGPELNFMMEYDLLIRRRPYIETTP